MRIVITNLDATNPPGKVADAEIHFDPSDGPLSGLKLIGFGIWERRTGRGGYNVTFPARQYSINGERRSFALLRPAQDANSSQAIRNAIIDAYRQAAGHTQPTDTPADTFETTRPTDDLKF